MIREIPPEGGAGPSGEDKGYEAVVRQLGDPPDVERLRRTDGPAQEMIAAQEKGEQVLRGGHAIRRHCAGTEACRLRALDGTTSLLAGESVPEDIPEHATGFTSREALMAAAACSWGSPEAIGEREKVERKYHQKRAGGASEEELQKFCRGRYVRSEIPVGALGTDWRNHVEGFTGEKETEFGDDSKVKTIWRMSPEGTWYLHTCYPTPE